MISISEHAEIRGLLLQWLLTTRKQQQKTAIEKKTDLISLALFVLLYL